MGYPKSLFLEEVNTEFICSVCLAVFEDPVMFAQCEHVYCTECIEEWTEEADHCPQDRLKITKKNKLKRPQRSFLNLLHQLQRKCRFARFGCTGSFKLGETEDHEKKCEANPEYRKECAECGAMLAKNEIKTHSCTRFLKQKIQNLEAMIYQTPMGFEEEKGIVEVGKKGIDEILAKIKEPGVVTNAKIQKMQKRVAKELSDLVGGTWTCDIRRGYTQFPTKSFRSPAQVEFYHKYYGVKIMRMSFFKPKRADKRN